jgi:hypothetical protein
LRFESFDPDLVRTVKIEPILMAHIDQVGDAQAADAMVDFGFVAQCQQHLRLPGGKFVALVVGNVFEEAVGELRTVETGVGQQSLRQRLERTLVLTQTVDLDPRGHRPTPS